MAYTLAAQSMDTAAVGVTTEYRQFVAQSRLVGGVMEAAFGCQLGWLTPPIVSGHSRRH